MEQGVVAKPDLAHEESPGSRTLRCRVYRPGQRVGQVHELAQISEILEEQGTLVWLDVTNPGPHDLDVLQEEFSLHPLAVEDAVQAHQRPKIEAYGTYYFLDIQAVTLEVNGLAFHEIAIFAGLKFIVTVRHDPVFPLKEIENRWHAHPEQLRNGSGFLLYTILDTVVDGYVPVVEEFESRVDRFEELLFADTAGAGEAEILPTIFAMKKDGQDFRRAVMPVRDILSPILRGDLDLFTEEQVVYYRDVYDHVVRIVDQLDSMRDMINSALQIQLSVVANRQGAVTKQLTVVATIFLPLSFVVGFFGQNFGVLVTHITSAESFWVLGIGSELVVILCMFAYFKVKGWF